MVKPESISISLSFQKSIFFPSPHVVLSRLKESVFDKKEQSHGTVCGIQLIGKNGLGEYFRFAKPKASQ